MKTMLLLIAASSCAGAGEGTPEIAITIEQPKTAFVLGQPIPLTVIFQNNLKRDVRIEGFCPTTGLHISGRTVCADGMSGGSVTSRSVAANTEIGVERLAGKPLEEFGVWELKGRSDMESFVLKAGGSHSCRLDLMKTDRGVFAIDSPGRFRVSLVFWVRAEASQGYPHDPLEWEGEASASPIEICVIGQSRPAEPAKRAFCRGRGLRECIPWRCRRTIAVCAPGCTVRE